MCIKVGSIRQIHKALLAAGYCISENALRRWVKLGVIPASYSGNTAYIAYDAVVNYLMSNSSKPA